jgi:phosphoenolpyruvate synthase/pyruvate phosphate dikinase
MMFTRPFNQLGKGDADIAGGKGASLGEMTQAGIPVPPGFVVLASTFDKFVEETDLDVDATLDAVDHKEIHTVESASEKIQALILAAEMPADIASEIKSEFEKLGAEYVAVRSSATAEDSGAAAWAGQLESYLNTTERDLLEKVKHCWASLFTPRAIFYRFEKELHKTKISVAVVVQKMVESDVSGIAFSVHPVTQDYNQLIIEAGLGLGEAIVSGQITPDSYVVEKEPRRIIDKNVAEQTRGIYRNSMSGNKYSDISLEKGSQQKLSDGQILELSELILKIETHYGFPCDIEWALERGLFFIVQSRPITTLSNNSPQPGETRPVYEKMFSRDVCLALVEVWCSGESTDPRQWTMNQQPKLPYILFEREGETTNCYMDPAGISWVKAELARLYDADPNFPMRCLEGFYKRAEYPRSIWLKQATLSRKELLDFLEKLKDLWVWYEAMWWLIEVLDERKDPFFVEMKSARVYVEQLIESDAVIKNSLRVLFPDKVDYAPVLLVSEIKSCEFAAEEILKKRLEHWIYTQGQLFVDEQRSDLEDKYTIKIRHYDASSTKEVSGQTAFGGKITGRARNLFNRHQLKNFLEGEILVAPMTTPDLLPAMKKAVAFVTDEGGITCHAAIIAREMKKPCVIGTKIATQVFKDGDMVEVDADKGVVRKI